jgi:hypothetical protein
MALDDRIEAVKKVSQALNTQDLPEVTSERVGPNAEQFNSYMNAEQNPHDVARVEKADVSALSLDKTQSSLMDEVKKLNTREHQMVQLTPEDLKNQTNGVIAQIEKSKAQLSQVKEIDPSYNKILTNHLSHVDESLKIALSKTGTEHQAVAATNTQPGLTNPIEKFLGYLTQGQYQLTHLNESIATLHSNKAELTPIAMLALQLKVGQVQQQIELFTSCLNKALESTKTIMNVQV